MSVTVEAEALPGGLAAVLADVDPADRPDAFGAETVRRVAATGALGALVPVGYGGLGLDHLRYGTINRAVAEVSSSLQSLFTVHAMVCRAVTRWGSAALREEFLPSLADGRATASFTLSESAAGNDIRRVETSARPQPDGWVLDGRKKWITFGRTADVFLVFAVAAAGPLALLVRRDDPGVRVTPAPAVTGYRAAQLAELELVDCRVPTGRVLGRPGSGLTHVATDALTLGRLCVAYGAWGLARSALSAAVARTIERHQFDGPLHRLQLVRGLLADAAVATEGAGLLCDRAARALDDRDEWAVADVLTAKLAASRAASTASAAAAQIHGAAGLLDGGPVDRYVRDARVLELIEGSSQLVQHLIADQLLARHRDRSATERAAGGDGDGHVH